MKIRKVRERTGYWLMGIYAACMCTAVITAAALSSDSDTMLSVQILAVYILGMMIVSACVVHADAREVTFTKRGEILPPGYFYNMPSWWGKSLPRVTTGSCRTFLKDQYYLLSWGVDISAIPGQDLVKQYYLLARINKEIYRLVKEKTKVYQEPSTLPNALEHDISRITTAKAQVTIAPINSYRRAA